MSERTAGPPRLVRVLAGDAVWDALLGAVLCLMPWLGPHAGLPAARPWPVFVLAGVACLAFSAVLAAACRSAQPVADLARIAAIGNAVAAVAAIVSAVLLGGPPGAVVALVVAAIGCAAFAVAEWRAARGG